MACIDAVGASSPNRGLLFPSRNLCLMLSLSFLFVYFARCLSLAHCILTEAHSFASFSTSYYSTTASLFQRALAIQKKRTAFFNIYNSTSKLYTNGRSEGELIRNEGNDARRCGLGATWFCGRCWLSTRPSSCARSSPQPPETGVHGYTGKWDLWMHDILYNILG